jgi:hypothetical protein
VCIALVVSEHERHAGGRGVRISVRAMTARLRHARGTSIRRHRRDDQQIDRGVATQLGGNITGDGFCCGVPRCSPIALPIRELPLRVQPIWPAHGLPKLFQVGKQIVVSTGGETKLQIYE